MFVFSVASVSMQSHTLSRMDESDGCWVAFGCCWLPCLWKSSKLGQYSTAFSRMPVFHASSLPVSLSDALIMLVARTTPTSDDCALHHWKKCDPQPSCQTLVSVHLQYALCRDLVGQTGRHDFWVKRLCRAACDM